MEAEKGREHDPETQIQAQQTNSEPTRKTGGGEGQEERNMKGWDLNTRHKRMRQPVVSHGPNELATYAESSAYSKWGRATELCCIFWSTRPGTIQAWIEGEIRWTSGQSVELARQLKRRVEQKGNRRAIKASSWQIRYRLITDTTPPPQLSPSFCLHPGFDLIITLRHVRRVRCRVKSRKHWKRTCLYSHMFEVSPHPIWETMRVSVYRPASSGRDQELLPWGLFCALFFVSALLSMPYGDFPLKIPRNCIHMLRGMRLRGQE